jgi:hypothetical protein
MLRRGATVSPADRAISSGDVMKEKPARASAVQKARNRPKLPPVRYGTKAPGGFCQFLKYSGSWCGPPPKNRTMPRMMSPMIVISLMLANQNSALECNG